MYILVGLMARVNLYLLYKFIIISKESVAVCRVYSLFILDTRNNILLFDMRNLWKPKIRHYDLNFSVLIT